MSAPETTAAAPVVVEQAVVPPATDAPAPAEESANVDAAAPAATEAPAQVEETPTKTADAAPVVAAVEEAPKDTAQPAEAEKKTPKLLARILAPFKGDGKKAEKKDKAPKSPKKKKKDDPEAPATSGEESSKEDTEPPKETKEPEPAKEPETPVAVGETSIAPEEAKKEEKKEEKKDAAKAAKLGRRISARVGDFFKAKPKPEVASSAKVDENPPKIDEPAPVAPLENVTEAPGEASATEAETVKPVEPAPAAAPVVAAAA